VLLGSAIAFLPIGVWLIVPLLGTSFPFLGELFLPTLIFFPSVVGVAILRYRLWEIDVLVNRAVVYGTVTAILAGIFTASIGLFQRLFVVMTGEQSDASLVVTTLIVAAAFTPIKNWIQSFVDRQFKEAADDTLPLRSFGEQVQSFIQLSDPREISQRLLFEAARSLHAESAAISLVVDGELRTVHAYGPWKGQAWASVPLELEGQRYGLVLLGPRRGRGQYTSREFEILQAVAHQVTRAISLAKGGNGRS
jgi:GAF domain-containing protein